jgi:hypothetical protein
VVVVKQGQRYGYRDYPQGVSEDFPLDFHSPLRLLQGLRRPVRARLCPYL